MDALMFGMVRSMWAPFVLMGIAIVIIAFFVGLSNSGNVAQYLSFAKETREAAVAGSSIVGLKVSIESVKAWLPAFKFFGMGLLFSGITMALAAIILTLRNAGIVLQKEIGVTPNIPPKPWTAHMFPMLMMLGLIILIVALVVGIQLAGVSAGYWNHSISAELDPAASGSVLLTQLAGINATKAWLLPLKFVGVATLLTGIALALFTIRYTLRRQTLILLDLVEKRA